MLLRTWHGWWDCSHTYDHCNSLKRFTNLYLIIQIYQILWRWHFLLPFELHWHNIIAQSMVIIFPFWWPPSTISNHCSSCFPKAPCLSFPSWSQRSDFVSRFRSLIRAGTGAAQETPKDLHRQDDEHQEPVEKHCGALCQLVSLAVGISADGVGWGWVWVWMYFTLTSPSLH